MMILTTNDIKRVLIFSFALLALIGCDRDKAKQVVPLVYDQRGGTERLGDAQKQRLVRRAELDAPQGQRIWYVLINCTYMYEGKLSYNASVYFTPSFRGPRLRKGKYLTYTSQMLDYWQVSWPNNTFDETLSIPTKDLWPFTVGPHPLEVVHPTAAFVEWDFTDAEIVEIVDSTRYILEGEKDWWFLKGRPFFSIIRKGDGTIEVRLGTQQGPLSGSWTILIIKKEANGYVLVSRRSAMS